MGFEVEPGVAGEARVRLNCGSHLHNPMQRVHGGAIAALADAAMGIAFGRTLLDDEDFSTIEMKVNYLRPVSRGVCRATAEIISMTKRSAVVTVQVENQGRLVAIAQGTCTVKLADEQTDKR